MSELDPKEERHIRRLLAVIDEFRKLDPDMQLPMVASFLLVVLKDGISRTEVMERLGVAGSTATRNLMGLMEKGRLGRPGHGLVSQRVNPDERRWRMHSLAPKGEVFLRRIFEILDPDGEEGGPKGGGSSDRDPDGSKKGSSKKDGPELEGRDRD